MPNGTVKFFNAGKGFGFITPDGGGKDVFFPTASLGAISPASLKPGQRLSFDEAPDAKGPKAVNLVLLAPPPKPVAKPRAETALTLYCDPSDDASHDALEGLRAAGHEPRIVDYIATPPAKEELRRISALLRDTNQSLVRRYDHLFHELRLDDRFISENEFWDAIVEHPGLINGPVVASSSKAVVYRDERSLELFLASDVPVAKPKVLSQGLLNMMMGKAPPPRPAPEPALVEIESVHVASKPDAPAREAPVKKASAPKKAEAPAKKAAAKPAPKAKPAAPAKKAAAKAPAKKPAVKKNK